MKKKVLKASALALALVMLIAAIPLAQAVGMGTYALIPNYDQKTRIDTTNDYPNGIWAGMRLIEKHTDIEVIPGTKGRHYTGSPGTELTTGPFERTYQALDNLGTVATSAISATAKGLASSAFAGSFLRAEGLTQKYIYKKTEPTKILVNPTDPSGLYQLVIRSDSEDIRQDIYGLTSSNVIKLLWGRLVKKVPYYDSAYVDYQLVEET